MPTAIAVSRETVLAWISQGVIRSRAADMSVGNMSKFAGICCTYASAQLWTKL